MESGKFIYWAVLIVANLPTYLFIGKLFFKDWDGFVNAIFFWIKPDIISALDGEWLDDKWASLLLLWYFAACALVVWAEHSAIQQGLSYLR